MVDQDGRSFFEGRAWVAEVVGDMAFVAANEGKTLVAIDLVTGESKVAYSVRVEGDGFGGVEAMATNGSHLAFVSTVYGQDRARSELVVIDGATGDIIAQKEIVEAAAARWIGPGKLAVSSFDEAGLHHVYDASTLEEIGTVVPTYGSSVVAGDMGLGLDQGTLLVYGDDEVRSIRTYPNVALWNVALIDATVTPDVPDDAPVVEPPPAVDPPPVVDPTGPTDVTLPPEAAPPPGDGGSAPGWPWLLVGTAVIAGGALTILRKRA